MTRKTWGLAGAALLVLVAITGGVVVMSGAKDPTPATRDAPPSTATVQRGKLSAMVSLDGTLTYRARSDGAPYAVINGASGTYTRLPDAGDEVDCGDVLYRVDDRPVLLLCGTVPAYRDLAHGDKGRDVRQLNRNLHRPAGRRFTKGTKKALERLQRAKGLPATGKLDVGDAVVLPGPARIATVSGVLGAAARPGARVAQATSDTLHVQVDLDASQQGEVKVGDRAQITLPGNTSVKGKVGRLGPVARAPAGQSAGAGVATIPAYIGLDAPKKARGLDGAPVRVDVRTKGVEDALNVPVLALVGRSGGGFSVEVVRDDGRRALVAVKLGLFDTSAGRVQVEGDLRAGDRVAVPSL